MMKKILTVLLASLLLAGHATARHYAFEPLAALADSNDYSAQLEKALMVQAELKREGQELKKRLKATTYTRDSLYNQAKKIKSQTNKHLADSKRAKDNQEASGYAGLYEKKKQLQDSIKRSNAALSRLQQQIAAADSNLAVSNQKKDELDKVRHEVSSRLKAENMAYLELPFAQQTAERLENIHLQCRPYVSDPQISGFAQQVDDAISNKSAYGDICRVLASKYTAEAVAGALERAKSMKPLSAVQKEEANALTNRLNAFPDGLADFKKVINQINENREGMTYSTLNFNDDLQEILPENKRGNINAVPYLKEKFDRYVRETSKRPNEHSDVEAEILGQ